MDFKDTLEYMYALLPMYQRVGNVAFKKDLTNTLKLCQALGNPQDKFKSIHIAGTNGKGSSAHTLASILQSAGYKTGLYTSPHLKSFTERIRVNGTEVDEQFVCSFIASIKELITEIRPSFFEVTVAMAFDYFSKQKVDVAVIEVGLGGRFDSTNIISPIVSLITSIGYDHMDMLGDTLPQIAFEKAGIIKQDTPVVISETQEEIIDVFRRKAQEVNAPLSFADQEIAIASSENFISNRQLSIHWKGKTMLLQSELGGEYQFKNFPGIIKVVEILRNQGFKLSDEQIKNGIAYVVQNTGLLGRWQKIGENPLIICDTVHNEAGVKYVVQQLKKLKYNKLFIIWGSVDGKKMDNVLNQLPKDAFYYFCEPIIPRALKAYLLKELAMQFGLKGEVVPNVNEALNKAKAIAEHEDLIFIGGSNFIIAEIEHLK
jgi:dihydrofolate synthase/folylpolyglutamate synthase